MATVSDRARELAGKYVGSTCMEHCWCQYSEKNGDDYVSCEDRLVELIEQALLAERRLAMEICAEIAYETGKEHGVPCRWSDQHARTGIMWTRKEIARDIRAAAEKENLK